ncbi:MAG: nucleotidyltransferase family protein [Ignavibacteriaceae bacterium]
MRAMILAAGLGTRLQPLTDNLPKALVKIRDKTLLEIAIYNLVGNGFNKIIINVHHFAEQVINFIEQNNFGADISISDERDKLLDTGGGLKKASQFFKDGKPFLLYNVDIISDLNLQTLYQANIKSNSIATLTVRKRESSRYLLFNSENILCGWKNTKSEELISSCSIDLLNEFAFSGIQIINPEIFSLMPDNDVFSMIDLYLDIMRDNKVIAHIDNDSFWLDVGKVESLKIAEENFHLISKS